MAHCSFQHVQLKTIVSVVPPTKVDCSASKEFFASEQLYERNKTVLGLGERYVVTKEDQLTSLDLGYAAVKSLQAKANLDLSKIEGLVVATSTPAFINPADAFVLQGRLGLPASTLCYTLTGLACNSFLLSLINVASLIESGAIKNCLLVCTDACSTDSSEHNIHHFSFADSASAILLEHTPNVREMNFVTHTQGELYENFLAPAGGKHIPIEADIVNRVEIDPKGNEWRLWDDLIDSMQVLAFVTRSMPKIMQELLELTQLTYDDVDMVAVNQSNALYIRTVGQMAKVPRNKLCSAQTFTRYSNTASGSIPLVICDQMQGLGQCLFMSSGIGLVAAAGRINMQGVQNFGVEVMPEVPKKRSRAEEIEYWVQRFHQINGS